MKKDEALEKLSQELLREEQPQAPQEPLVYRNFANNYGKDLRNFASNYKAYNADCTDEDPQELSEELLEKKKERLWPLAVLDLLLLGGILGIAAYWVFGLGILS